MSKTLTVSAVALDNEIFSLFSGNLDVLTTLQLFSKTKRILQIYRVCVWNLNTSAKDIKKDLEFMSGVTAAKVPTAYHAPPPDNKQLYADLLDAAREKGYELYETWIPERIHSMSKSSVLLDFAVRILELVRSYPYNGQKYYEILYYNYFDVSNTCSTGINLQTMNRLGYFNEQSYYKHKKEAISLYSAIFWDVIDDQLVMFLTGTNE